MVVGAYDRCFCGVFVFSEIVGARGQLAFQGLFLALIFGGSFAFLGNKIGEGEKALVWLSPVSKALLMLFRHAPSGNRLRCLRV
jgi:hypothetical protein